MGLICDGQATKHEVLETTVAEYREVYRRTQQAFNVLVDVRARLCGSADRADLSALPRGR